MSRTDLPGTGSVSSQKVSPARRLWTHVPAVVRRPVVRLMRSERIRLPLLRLLRIREESGFYTLSPGGLEAIDAALSQIASTGADGDYFEFGLYRGFMLWHAQRTADDNRLGGMRFFGFDSFEGLPELEGNDRKSGRFISGDYRCTRSDVEQMLTDHDFDWSRSALVEGFYDQSLTDDLKSRHAMRSAALVMIDCDLYQSTVPVLAFLADQLRDGTIILFDDWNCFGDSSEHGERKAFQEFLDAHPEWTPEPFMKFKPYGEGFVMRRTTAGAG